MKAELKATELNGSKDGADEFGKERNVKKEAGNLRFIKLRKQTPCIATASRLRVC